MGYLWALFGAPIFSQKNEETFIWKDRHTHNAKKNNIFFRKL